MFYCHHWWHALRAESSITLHPGSVCPDQISMLLKLLKKKKKSRQKTQLFRSLPFQVRKEHHVHTAQYNCTEVIKSRPQILNNSKIKVAFFTSVQLLDYRHLVAFCNYTITCKSFPVTPVSYRNLDIFYFENISGSWSGWNNVQRIPIWNSVQPGSCELNMHLQAARGWNHS